jgi:hypothetical protein
MQYDSRCVTREGETGDVERMSHGPGVRGEKDDEVEHKEVLRQ